MLLLLTVLLQAASSGSADGDACRLLDAKEIAAAQGEAPKEVKPSQRADGPLQIQDCVFVLPTYSKSISLQVTRGPKDEARDRWKRMFASPPPGESGEEKEKTLKPEPVRGLGDEAFWIDESPSGALYALRKRAFVRISIGGPEPRHTKIKRAVALARKALRRL